MNPWYGVSRRDPRAIGLYANHYSSQKNKKGVGDWLKYGITSPGETIVLMTSDNRALFAWVKAKYRMDKNEGVYCYIFRNEGPFKSSELIQWAEKIAWRKWPGERLFTHVDPRQIKSENPGYCFKMAGWKTAGYTQGGLVCLEKLP